MFRKYALVGVSAFILGSGATAFVNARATAAAPDAGVFHMLQLFGSVLATVEGNYVTKVENKSLIEAAIQGMLASLDPHSSYLDPADFKDMREQTRGEYGGLGMELTVEEGVPKVIAPMDDTPASKAGVMSGDFILEVNGESVVGQRLDEVVKKLRGEIGETVELKFSRDKKTPFTVKLVRQTISVKSVRHRMEGDYGYIRISNVNENTGRETAEAARELVKNKNLKGVILDLRNNPGGLLDQSVAATDVFLDGGEVVSERGRDPQDIERFFAKPGDVLNGLPIVVVVNGGTASAAEIIAGALQDRKRAEIVGLTSFGKGSVQSVVPLRGGADGALKLTTGRYYTPSGRSIQRTGIEPDLEVARSKQEAEIAANADLQFSEASFKNALNASEGKVRKAAHSIADTPPETFDKKGDYQLARAIEVLKAGSVKTLTTRERLAKTQVAAVDKAKADKLAEAKPKG